MTTKLDLTEICPELAELKEIHQKWVDYFRNDSDLVKAVDRAIEPVATTMLSQAAQIEALAEEKQKAVEEAIDETSDNLNDTWLECVKAALSGEELFDDEMSTEQRQAVELIWKAARTCPASRKGDADE